MNASRRINIGDFVSTVTCRWARCAMLSLIGVVCLWPAAGMADGLSEAQGLAREKLEAILADHAAPVLPGGSHLAPYAVDPITKLPDTATQQTFLAATPPNGIYWMRPPNGLPANRLARVSSGGAPAFDAARWAYASQAGEAACLPGEVPQWIEVTDPGTGAARGRVAFAIWDESGKIDLNLAGPDGFLANGSVDPTRINGLAP